MCSEEEWKQWFIGSRLWNDLHHIEVAYLPKRFMVSFFFMYKPIFVCLQITDGSSIEALQNRIKADNRELYGAIVGRFFQYRWMEINWLGAGYFFFCLLEFTCQCMWLINVTFPGNYLVFPFILTTMYFMVGEVTVICVMNGITYCFTFWLFSTEGIDLWWRASLR